MATNNSTNSQGINAPARLPEQSRKVFMAKELQAKTALDDSIYTTSVGIHTTEKKMLPDAVFLDIAEVDKESSSATTGRITMVYPLREPGVLGSDRAIGREETFETKAAEVHCNNNRKVIVNPGYGKEEIEMGYLDLVEKHKDGLAQWAKDDFGLGCRRALVETYDHVLSDPHNDDSATDTSDICQPRWNSNVFVAGIKGNAKSQPLYDPNVATHTQNITTAIKGLGQANGVYGRILDSVAMDELINFATKKRITQLSLPVKGGKGWVLTVSDLQAAYISNPAWSKHNLGSRWVDGGAMPESEKMGWPGVIGSYRCLLIVQDMMMPTLKLGIATETGAPDLLVAKYVMHGDTDNRDRDGSEGALDLAILHGRAALYKWEPQKWMPIKDQEDYGKRVGAGIAQVRGIGIPIYRYNLANQEEANGKSGTAFEQFSSVLAICGLPSTVPA
ncbi:MAG: hypothetical protein FWB85_01185 [Chitinispirillia bacterium]|nr:hypothetical protein [Chitinispirillia bacterium]MCL2241273.1 hypothetical protein [Chitinispirillia bacterium]